MSTTNAGTAKSPAAHPPTPAPTTEAQPAKRKLTARSAMPTASTLVTELAAIEKLDLEGLRSYWQRVYGPPPKLRSVEFLRLQLAWRLQADVFGGLDRDLRRKIDAPDRNIADQNNLSVGTRLSREWNGTTVEVLVTADGFRFEGQTYKSLSAIAQLVTGATWSGPRFFGLRRDGVAAPVISAAAHAGGVA